jgi:rhodanese-related sulfurtransferase
MRILPLLLLTLGLLLLSACRLSSQDVPDRLQTSHEPLNQKLNGLVSVDGTTISAPEAAALDSAIFVDTRELAEYRVSHLPGAIHLGYDTPDYDALAGIDAARPLVLYCTVGYRSERMVERLRERGFDQVYNLYGSLYAWRLAGFPLEDQHGPTDRIHTYNRKWGSFIPDSLGQKVY